MGVWEYGRGQTTELAATLPFLASSLSTPPSPCTELQVMGELVDRALRKEKRGRPRSECTNGGCQATDEVYDMMDNCLHH